ncbi:MAG: hypothetical protein PHC34_02825 [Candidatus Gastranaerophilales bacterium]|nr:hypothetical protein [Candidatus Gastranaerophilales bacterium]
MKELTLPSGKTAKFKDGKGRDLLNAQRKAKTPDEILFALIAEIAEIDGQTVIYEDLLEMDLEDVLALQAEISGKFQSLQPNVSSTLPKQPAGSTAK